MSLKQELMQFTGTTQYYKMGMSKLKSTEGIFHFITNAKCFWVHDIIESVQHLPKVKKFNNFLIWRIIKKGEGCVVESYWDSEESGEFSKSKLVYSQKVGYTDFPFDELGDFEFYQENDVLLLKREH